MINRRKITRSAGAILWMASLGAIMGWAIFAGIEHERQLDRIEAAVAVRPEAPQCWLSATEDSEPRPGACDYHNGAWWPVTDALRLPPCDDDAPGKPIIGTCWLLDDDGPNGERRVSVWRHPYDPAGPWLVLEGSQ